MARTSALIIAAITLIAGTAFTLGLIGTPGAEAEDTRKQVTKEDVLTSADFGRPGDIVLGDENAPVSVIEYASTTCGHCATFKVKTFPQFKAAYVDTGVAKYTLREFPTAPVVLSASAFMLARCVEPARYYGVIDVLFRTQKIWAYVRTAEEGREKLKAVARQAGIGEAKFEECLSNDAEYQRIRAVQKQGSDVFDISATPTLIINGDKHVGLKSFEELEEILQAYVPGDAKSKVEEAKAALTEPSE